MKHSLLLFEPSGGIKRCELKLRMDSRILLTWRRNLVHLRRWLHLVNPLLVVLAEGQAKNKMNTWTKGVADRVAWCFELAH